MKRPCVAATKAGRPCKGTANTWPDGVIGDPQLCGTHMPREIAKIREAGFADHARRRQERLDTRTPECWAWPLPTVAGSNNRPLRLLAEWQDGRCAVCGFRAARLVQDHDHDTGLVRGLLCPSCNGQEPNDTGLFQKYRTRPPAQILGIRMRYWDRFNGYALPREPVRNSLDDHPAYGLAARLAARLQRESGGAQ